MNIDLSDKEAEFLLRALINNYAEDYQDFEQNISDTGICGLLIGKFISKNYNLMSSFRRAREDKFGEKERIKNLLFMGTGWHSIIMKNKLHKRLEFAVGQLGGIQQNGGMGTEFDEELDVQAKQDIKFVLQDMLIAFGLTPDDLK